MSDTISFTEGDRLAFVSGDVPAGNRVGPSISVKRVHGSDGSLSALLRMGPPDAVISEPSYLRALAVALLSIADEIEAH